MPIINEVQMVSRVCNTVTYIKISLGGNSIRDVLRQHHSHDEVI